MLVELSLMEQRYQRSLPWSRTAGRSARSRSVSGSHARACTPGSPATRSGGLAALADRSHRPASCPHQTAPELEARICELRREHPGWGPRRIDHELSSRGCEPPPSRSSIYRCLKRHQLIELRRRK